MYPFLKRKKKKKINSSIKLTPLSFFIQSLFNIYKSNTLPSQRDQRSIQLIAWLSDPSKGIEIALLSQLSPYRSLGS